MSRGITCHLSPPSPNAEAPRGHRMRSTGCQRQVSAIGFNTQKMTFLIVGGFTGTDEGKRGEVPLENLSRKGDFS